MPDRPIALYLPSLRGGGAERVMVTLANGFAERGYAVDLVLAKAEGPFLPEVARKVRIVDLDARRVLSSLPGLVRYLRREQPRAMLSALNYANVIALLARRLAGVPTRLVVSEHAHLSSSLGNAPNRRGRLMPWDMRYGFRGGSGRGWVFAGDAGGIGRWRRRRMNKDALQLAMTVIRQPRGSDAGPATSTAAYRMASQAPYLAALGCWNLFLAWRKLF